MYAARIHTGEGKSIQKNYIESRQNKVNYINWALDRVKNSAG